MTSEEKSKPSGNKRMLGTDFCGVGGANGIELRKQMGKTPMARRRGTKREIMRRGKHNTMAICPSPRTRRKGKTGTPKKKDEMREK